MKNSDTGDRTSRGSMTDTSNLVPMSSLHDYKIADGNPDVRGWDVITRDGKKVGEVDELLVDPTAERVRYLALKLDRNLLSGATGQGSGYVLIPVGNARLDESNDRIILDSMNDADVATLPAYDRDTFTREHETSLRQRFDQNYTRTEGTGGDFYSNDLYNEDRLYGDRRRRAGAEDEARLTLSEEELAVGKQRQQAGEVGVRKRVETERVQQSVPVMHEEVTVERRPITEGSATSAQIGEDEIRVPLTKEEVVVEKRVVPKEEVVIKKHAVEGQQQVEADVRRERAEVLRDGEVERDKRR